MFPNDDHKSIHFISIDPTSLLMSCAGVCEEEKFKAYNIHVMFFGCCPEQLQSAQEVWQEIRDLALNNQIDNEVSELFCYGMASHE